VTKIIERLKSLYGLTASLGVVVPGYAFFTSYAPPIFKGITLITSAVCVAFLVYTLNLRKSTLKISKGIRLIIISFVVLLLYLFLFSYTTVKVDNESALQAGFGNSRWSLTPSAIKMIESGNCPRTDNATLLTCAGFDEDNIPLIWKKWTINFAGLILIIVFTASSILWTVGWGKIANWKIR
jgi:hypothetical protein